ncbi:hypothetical protein DFP73DRAFT_543283 [Morchella snyderi]|nr:hypothetical protein DFP73DRAFT_543283 [Morchella snyderi]
MRRLLLLLLELLLLGQHLLLLAKLVDDVLKVLKVLGALRDPCLDIALLLGRDARLLRLLRQQLDLVARRVHLLPHLRELCLDLGAPAVRVGRRDVGRQNPG